MKTIIGLGNPEEKYKNNRHNVGFMFVDFLEDDFRKFKSDKFMNNSGEFVVQKIRYSNLELEDLYIAHDDLDIPLGEYKITKKSPKGHNGILSIDQYLDPEDYWKIRIGIDNRDPENRTTGDKYVLSDFSNEEKKVLEEVFEKIKKELNG